jgi:Xaa-Pro aminopeptidase
MSITAETWLKPLSLASERDIGSEPGRRSDIDARQVRVARLLEEVGAEGLLIFQPENFAWLTSGATARGILDPAEFPALYFTPEQRWLLASNVAVQRLFDEELDGLGFQLKEWPWFWSRERLLNDLCQGRTLACDLPFGSARDVSSSLRLLRRTLTVFEQACLHALGQIVSHALEATCRTMSSGASEREIAGQISHRLLHRGAVPLHIGVAADGRSRLYRQFSFTATPIRQYAVLTVVARKYGLYAAASRSVSFGTLDHDFQAEYNATCKIGATYLASTWPDALPREILAAGKRIFQLSGYEHEWRLSPQGHLTGRLPVEQEFLPHTEELLQAGWAITWNPTVGAATVCDTFLVDEKGPSVATPAESWPLKRIRVQGADFFRPDILQR